MKKLAVLTGLSLMLFIAPAHAAVSEDEIKLLRQQVELLTQRLDELEAQNKQLAESAQQAARHDHVREIRLDHEAATKLLHQQHGFDWATIKSAVIFGKWQRRPTEFAELFPGVGAVASVAVRVRLALVEFVFVDDELFDTVSQHRLKFIQ